MLVFVAPVEVQLMPVDSSDLEPLQIIVATFTDSSSSDFATFGSHYPLEDRLVHLNSFLASDSSLG